MFIAKVVSPVERGSRPPNKLLCLCVCFRAARYENLNAHLSKQHKWDHGITGLLLIYPSCLLHIIEVSSAQG